MLLSGKREIKTFCKERKLFLPWGTYLEKGRLLLLMPLVLNLAHANAMTTRVGWMGGKLNSYLIGNETVWSKTTSSRWLTEIPTKELIVHHLKANTHAKWKQTLEGTVLLVRRRTGPAVGQEDAMNTVLTHSSSQSNRGFSSVSGNLFLFLAFPSHVDYCFSSIISVNTPRVSAHAHPTPTMLVFSGESPVISEGLLLPLPVSLKLSIWCFIWNVTHCYSTENHQERRKPGLIYLI